MPSKTVSIAPGWGMKVAFPSPMPGEEISYNQERFKKPRFGRTSNEVESFALGERRQREQKGMFLMKWPARCKGQSPLDAHLERL